MHILRIKNIAVLKTIKFTLIMIWSCWHHFAFSFNYYPYLSFLSAKSGSKGKVWLITCAVKQCTEYEYNYNQTAPSQSQRIFWYHQSNGGRIPDYSCKTRRPRCVSLSINRNIITMPKQHFLCAKIQSGKNVQKNSLRLKSF